MLVCVYMYKNNAKKNKVRSGVCNCYSIFMKADIALRYLQYADVHTFHVTAGSK